LVLIASCNGNGSDHLTLAHPGLEKRVPTFIDKPMSFSIDQALQLLWLAHKHQTPLLSASLYQTDFNTMAFARRLPEVGALSRGSIECSSTHLAATIGAVCAAQIIFGTGIEVVRCLHAPERHVVFHLDYGSAKNRPAEGITIHCPSIDTPFPATSRFSRTFAAAYGWERAIQGMIFDAYSGVDGAGFLLEQVRAMIQSGQSDRTLTPDMVRAVAVCQAMRESLETGKPTRIAYPDLHSLRGD
jgi:hypothetical protein